MHRHRRMVTSEEALHACDFPYAVPKAGKAYAPQLCKPVEFMISD